MTRTTTAWRIERRFAASLAPVDRICRDVRIRLKGACSDADSFAVELLLREALVNAVRHGCRHRPEGQVACEVRRRGAMVRVAVSDDGPGFDWRGQQRAVPNENATSGRGVRLYAVYADRAVFNERGNSVVLHRRLREPPEGQGS